MKNLSRNILVGILFAFIILGSSRVMAAEVEMKTINLSGNGRIKVKPDICIVDFSVITRNKDSVKANKENADRTSKLIEGLKKVGIKEEDIVTNTVYVNPVYDYEKDSEELKHYEAINSIEVTIRDLDKIGNIIDKGIELGADSVGYIRFAVSKTEEVYSQALVEAIKNADKKLDSISKALKWKSTEIIDIEEVSRNYDVEVSMESNNVVKEASEDLAKPLTDTPIKIKDIIVEASVNVKYSFVK